jgi:IS30 family transposase
MEKRYLNALIDMFCKMPKAFVKSVTYDNGAENIGHIEINRLV